MGRASERVKAGAFLGAALLAACLVPPLSSARASSATAEGMGLFAPGLGCSPAETLVGTHELLARVRTDAPAAAPATRAGATPSGARNAPAPRPEGRQHAARSPAPAARSKAKAPRSGEGEPRAAVLRSFYSCNAAPNLADGTGWRLVGPLRRG